MAPSTFNATMNGNDIDFNTDFYTLADAIDMVEFQESLNIDDCYDDLEVDAENV